METSQAFDLLGIDESTGYWDARSRYIELIRPLYPATEDAVVDTDKFIELATAWNSVDSLLPRLPRTRSASLQPQKSFDIYDQGAKLHTLLPAERSLDIAA